MTLEADLFTALKGLVGNRVAPVTFPQPPAVPTWPAIRYNFVSNIPVVDISQGKVARAGKAQWIGDILPKLDRDAYVNPDGSLMSDAEITAVLDKVWLTIATDGASDITPGAHQGSGSIKNRGSEHRALHFAKADDYLDYQAKYGERSLLETMVGHIDSHSRDIATMQTFGPNAEAAYKYLADYAQQEMAKAAPAELPKINTERGKTDKYFDYATGRFGAAANPTIAKAFDTIKTLMVLSRLGSAAISAIPDTGTLHMVALSNHIPQWKAFKFELKAYLSKGFRDFVRAQGVGVESVTHSISRFGEETFGHGMPSVAANVLFRVSGLNALDSARRVATGAMLMDNLGTLTRQHATLADLHPGDNHVLLSRGLTDTHWAVWKLAQLDGGLLTPEGIARIPDAALKPLGVPARLRADAMQTLVGVVNADTNLAVPMPTAKNQADVQFTMGNPQRGTFGGELWRSVLQFKAFPLSIIANNWARMLAEPTPAGKIKYGASYVAAMTVLGGLTVQINSLLLGTDPQDMSDPKFVGRAMVKGGALGLYGDLILNPVSTDYKQTIADFAGPLASTAQQLYGVAQTAYRSTDDTQRTNLPAELLRFAKSNTPFQNLWYTKAVTDHLIFQALQDYLSPGYASRIEQRARREFGTSYYWPPATAPDQMRAPDLSSGLGR